MTQALKKFDLPKSWKLSIYVTTLIIYFHFFLEWLFHVTKASFLSSLSPHEKGCVLFVAPLIFSSFVFVANVLIFGLLKLFNRFSIDLLGRQLTKIIPAFFIAVSFFILIDNFTYTIFQFGLVSLQNPLRLFYGGIFLCLIYWVYSSIFKDKNLILPMANLAFFKKVTFGLIIISGLFFGLRYSLSQYSFEKDEIKVEEVISTDWPDILMISADALEQKYLSLFEKESDAELVFSKLAKNGIVSRYCFPNSNKTSGSLPSILTGKYPTTTHVLNSLHFLKGRDSYQHFPGMLRKYGYKSVQAGWPGLADSTDWNLRNAFHEVNGKSIDKNVLQFLSSFFNGRLNIEILFLERVLLRAINRLRHAFGGAVMVSTHIMETRHGYLHDARKTEVIKKFFTENWDPVFAQVHYDRTKSYPKKGIGQLDEYIEEILEHRKIIGRDRELITVILSDHGKNYAVNHRLPLIINFPTKVKSINPNKNIQNLDIVPTLLDYLKIKTPSWMEGKSLFRRVDPYEPIISVFSTEHGKAIFLEEPGPNVVKGPININIVICNKFYKYHILKDEFEESDIENYFASCDPQKQMSHQEIKNMMLDHLKSRGYAI